MEIINNNYNPAGGPTSSNGRPSGPDNQARNLFFGTLLVAAGFLWLLRDFHVVPYLLFNTIFSWQMLLAVTGAYLLTIRRWIVGWIMLAAGLCLVILDLTGIHVSFAKIIFPLVLISAGAAIILSINKQQ